MMMSCIRLAIVRRRREKKGWKASVGCCGGLAVESCISERWRQVDCINNLPDEILCDIFTRLPLSVLLRLRPVCWTWNRLILEDRRVSQVRGSCGASFLRALRTRDGKMMAVAYNPVLRQCSSALIPLHASAVGFWHFIMAAGSLLFFGNYNNCAPVCMITVCNPLSNCWRSLPELADGPTPVSFPLFRRITIWTVGSPQLSDRRCHYKILVIKFRCYFQTHIYDSLADYWKPCSSIPLCGYDFFTDLYSSTGPCVGGLAFYVVGNSVKEVKSWSIWAFDLEGEVWFNFAVPAKVLEGVVSYMLTECLGHLILITRGGTADWDKRCIHIDTVRLWELRLTRRRKGSKDRLLTVHSWSKLSDMPQHMVPLYSRFFSQRRWWHPNLELKDCTVVTHCIFFLKGRVHGTDAIVFDYLEKSWSTPYRDFSYQLPQDCLTYDPGFCLIPNATAIP